MSSADDLERLSRLLDEGKLTRDEFETAKSELLAPATASAPRALAPSLTSDKTRWAIIGGGVFMAIGSMLPWAQVGIFTLEGTRGDGVFTLVLGGIAAILGIVRKHSAGIWVVVCGGLGILIAWSALSGLDTEQIAGGLYLTFIASIVVALAGIDLFREGRRKASSVANGDTGAT